MPLASTDGTPSRRLHDLADRLGRRPGDIPEAGFAVEAPLRICPLGAHIDHQGGRVTGMAVDRSVRLAAVGTDQRRVVAESADFPGGVDFDLGVRPASATGRWGDYLRAAVLVLGERHTLGRGLRLAVEGDFAGSGLSSSAAVLIAYLTAVAAINGIDLGRDETVELVQRAENDHVGVACGRLDPSVILNAEPGCLTHIDCRDGAVRQNRRGPGGAAPAVIAAFSGQSRSLAGSGFNDRVAECRGAARRLLELAGMPVPEVPRLVDVPRRVFKKPGNRLDPVFQRRATHFFGEMERVDAGEKAWRDGDLARFGDLVNASGESSIVNYESGTPPLVTLFELLSGSEGVYGSRFSGAGFGGTCIALAEPEACEEIVASVAARYAEAHPEQAASAVFTVCGTAGPPQLVRLEV